MKKLVPFTVLAMLLTTSVASADRRGHDRRDDRRGGDRRGHVDRGDHRQRDHRPRIVVRDRRHDRNDRYQRRPVYVRGGSFHFHGGIVKRWRAPVIRQRYFDVRYRPAPVVEYYDTMPGYVWRAGHWQWTGYEWTWQAGYYDVDPAYGQGYGYDQGYGYQQQPVYAPPSPYSY